MKMYILPGLFLFVFCSCVVAAEYPRNLTQAQVGEWATYRIDSTARDGERSIITVRRTMIAKNEKSATFKIETLNTDGTVQDTVATEVALISVSQLAAKPRKSEAGQAEVKLDQKTFACEWKKTFQTSRPAERDIEFEVTEYYAPEVPLDGLVKREKIDSLGLKQITTLINYGAGKP